VDHTAYLLAAFDVVGGVFMPVQWMVRGTDSPTQDLRLSLGVLAEAQGNSYGAAVLMLRKSLETRAGVGNCPSAQFMLERMQESCPEAFRD
jgi:hypothetical protein